ncbi:P-loop containing nucleoside triphosphate hydrolase protein [Sporodiniella umbellata]|nr:P-loop containing nucleoside triphosphate hydrolase protein [Sporodiniella umbellata]
MTKEGQATAVQVALRIRPLTDRDRAQPRFAKLANDDVLKLQDKTVQVVSQNKHFSFDHVFGTTSTQEDVFSAVGDNLIRKFIEGYNITILAYGQTSSGKTHTMGTASVKNSIDEGIVPRSMTLLFDLLQQDSTRPDSPALSVSSSSSTSRRKSSRASKTPSFLSQPYSSSRPGHKNTVTVSFIEIYNEDLHDLLSSAPPEESPPITIREDTKGNIYWTGVKEVQVQSAEDVLYFLEQGTQNRATGATDMNEKSSRSHAIFSVTLRQEKATANEPKKSTSTSRPGSRPASSLSNRTRASHTPKATSDESEKTITVSKFHFVDLAGSERLKRTAAQGDRRKEGININAGLLALGNVISALASDSARKKLHVPYRDSKLTRLLQDSLGGNATTVMIACVSPAEYNLAETLNTLQYANRARSIKNRSEKNEVEEWMTTDNLELLRSIVGKLKHELKYVKSSGSKPEEDEASDDDHSLEQRLLIADLQRQVEELDGEASVTRERNRMVERELHRLRLSPPEKKEDDFQHLVEPVIEEYEKSISNLESQLALTKAALNYSDVGFEEQQSKIHRLESLGKSHEHSLETLQAQLAKVTERDQNNESYILELENKLMVSAKDASRDQCMLSDLKSRIAKLKETDQNTEQYIHDLEQRLAAAESQDKQHKALIEELESKVDARERTHLELLKKLAHQPSPLPSPQENEAWRAQLASLEKERDALKHQVDLLSVVKPAQIPDEPSRSPPAITQRATRPKQTLADERDSAEALIQANAQLAQASERADRLQHTLDRLQVDHQTTLKELDEALQRYHETVEQLDFMDHSRASSTTHEEESTVLDLSKEMAMAKEGLCRKRKTRENPSTDRRLEQRKENASPALHTGQGETARNACTKDRRDGCPR